MPTYTPTRRALHGIAELLLAGPQHGACGKIRLHATPGGFGTVFTPDVRLDGMSLVHGDRRVLLDRRPVSALGAELGLTPTGLGHVYQDVSGLDPDAALTLDPDAVARIAAVYALGDAALRQFAPGCDPVLWPEHFDLAITVDDVNFGVTPGDDAIEDPYMYIGPWSPRPQDEFWNQPFGAARPLPADVAAVVSFFEAGRARLAG